MDDRSERFERLVRDHVDELMRHARGRSAPQDAQDAVTEALCGAWRLIEHAPVDPLPWLLRMTDSALDRMSAPS